MTDGNPIFKNTALRMSTGFMKLHSVLHEFQYVSTSLADLTRRRVRGHWYCRAQLVWPLTRLQVDVAF